MGCGVRVGKHEWLRDTKVSSYGVTEMRMRGGGTLYILTGISLDLFSLGYHLASRSSLIPITV